ncbi:hypothetical protein Goshw_009871 [Gossypium schwendimanii]|uniref:Uncharacterized protein n=1 Tax=Gossypium schwendimanii TaxID=34291 RepID=A0A7J9N5J9_GOSSC|nr:hypothetical protein [Gossypium schwendimanii]
MNIEKSRGGTFHLFALVSSGELLISPSVSVEGVGEAEFIKGISTAFLDESFDNRCETGFPGNLGLRALPTGISKLISLECLDLSLTAISELPVELKSLTKLKALDLRCMNNLIKIPQHLISSFSKLQTFRMWLPTNRDYQYFEWGEPKVFDVLCLENLERLETLQFFECEYGGDETGKAAYLDFFTENLSEVASVIEIPYLTPFLKLETLELEFLPELKSIYWDALPFPCLKLIHIDDSQELKKLLLNSDSAKRNLLTIEGSEDWWARVERESEATRDAFLPSFKSIKY